MWTHADWMRWAASVAPLEVWGLAMFLGCGVAMAARLHWGRLPGNVRLVATVVTFGGAAFPAVAMAILPAWLFALIALLTDALAVEEDGRGTGSERPR